MDMMESNLYEEDFLSSLFDATKDDFSNQTVYPNLKLSNAVDFDNSPLGLSLLDEDCCSKVGREGEEDEGFEDFVEEEIVDALQKDSDPTLADSSALSADCKPGPLDLFFPMIGTEGDNMLVSSKPFAPIPEEILDFDQGVAMESDHPPRHNSVFSDCEVSFDLPFSSPPPSTHSTPFDAALHSPAQFISTPAFHNYPPSTSSASITPPTMGINTKRQNSELDLICSVMQSHTEQPTTPTYTNSSQYNPNIPIDATSELLNLLNPSVSEEPFNNFSPFPASLMLNNEQFKPTNLLQYNSAVQLPLCGTAETSHANMGDHSPNYSESNYSEDTSQRSVTPTPSLLVPSPVNSVMTDYSETDYGKDGCGGSSGQSESSVSGTSKKIVSMPFYEFKKILDSPSVSERDKEQVKAIRKRGKNKVAAKHCRQRKLEVISRLQQEVDKLRGYKAQLVMKSLSLERKIEADKRRVALNFSHVHATVY